MSTELGKLFIRLQAVVPDLQFLTDEERDEFLKHYSRNLPEYMRQTVLVWQSGKKRRKEMNSARTKDADLADIQRRERERAQARRKTQ